MHNCITLLALVTLTTVSSVVGVNAGPLTLLNCATGSYQGTLKTIQPGGVAAGVVMPSVEQARRRANVVIESSVDQLIQPGDPTAIVVVSKTPERLQRGDTTCVIFGGG